MFRMKKGINRKYEEQGYIYFLSRNYLNLNDSRQRYIENLCFSCGEEYYAALFEFVTTDRSGAEICLNHYISKSTLYRIVRRYYEEFEIE